MGWTLRSWQDLQTGQRLDLASRIADAVATSAQSLIERNDLTPLRMLVSEVAQRSGLEECYIELPDGGILAHVDPQRVTVKEIPAVWPSQARLTGDSPRASPVEAHRALDLGDGKTATVVVRAARPALPWNDGLFAGGLLVIGLLAALSILALIRVTVRTLRPLRAIQSSMRALAAGDTSPDALSISPRFGDEATAWNSYLATRESDRSASLDEQIDGTASSTQGVESLLERGCDALPQGMVLLDGAGRIRFANGAASVLLGAKKVDLPGRLLVERIEDDRVKLMINGVFGEGGGQRRRASIEVTSGTGDDASVLRYSLFRPAGDASGAGLLIIDDLTQQRVADRARDSFVAQATHELRTPLTNIRLYIETLLESGEESATTRGECVNVINQEARRLERMVSDMLSVAEMESGSLKLHADDVRFDALLEELRADYQAMAREKNITLNFDLPPKLPVIRGDRDKIAMSLHNLIGNAIKYTPANGTVVVTLQDTPTSVMVMVKDSGIGVAAEERERIFEKFYRSRDRRIAKITGTGLGLAIARDVIRLHGGDITVDSELDQGSTFTLTLPRLAQAA
ncbi:MAG: PAS domain-containing protein [Phycisphaeraceae bacterium]|nr:PAS domain-containing protein [Phycisphaeraceae bacterium]